MEVEHAKAESAARATTSRGRSPTMFAITIAFTAKLELMLDYVIIGQRKLMRPAYKEVRPSPSAAGALEDHPWGESAAKVGKKVFVFMGLDQGEDGTVHFTVKLPEPRRGVVAALTETPATASTAGTATCMPRRMPRWRCSRPDRGRSYRAVAPRALA